MFDQQRESVAYFMRRLYTQGLTTCSGGNISLRADAGHVLVTPSGLDKGELQAGDIAVFTMEGENLTPRLKPSIETGMHLAVLRARPDVDAVVHAHPVTATAFAASTMEVDVRLTAEAYMVLGTPRRAPYRLMGTPELADVVADCLQGCDVALMQNHGVICVGKTLLAAFDRLEVMEAAARMTWITASLRSAAPMDESQMDDIEREYRRKR